MKKVQAKADELQKCVVIGSLLLMKLRLLSILRAEMKRSLDLRPRIPPPVFDHDPNE